MNRRQNLLGLILAVISAVSFGTYPIIVQRVLESGVNPPTILFLRFSGCSALLWLICFLDRKKKLKISLPSALRLLLVGMVIYAAMSALNLAALTRISPSLASLLLCAYPVFVALIYVLLGKEHVSWRMSLCLAACVFGMYLFLNVETGNPDVGGILLAATASITYACYVVVGSTVDVTVNPITRAALIMSGACISYTITGTLSGGLRFDFDLAGWLWLGCIIVVATIIPITLFWTAIAKSGALNISIVGILEPISTVVLSVLLLQETMVWYQVLGILIVITAIIVIQRRSFR